MHTIKCCLKSTFISLKIEIYILREKTRDKKSVKTIVKDETETQTEQKLFGWVSELSQHKYIQFACAITLNWKRKINKLEQLKLTRKEKHFQCSQNIKNVSSQCKKKCNVIEFLQNYPNCLQM